MEEKYLDEIVEIENLSFSTPWSRVAFRECLNNGEVLSCFVTLIDNAVVGYMCLSHVYEDGELLNIAVSPNHRKQGLGGLMLDYMTEYLREKQVERILLEVRMSNNSARSLYTSKGFSPIGIRKKYYKAPTEDGIVMEKHI